MIKTLQKYVIAYWNKISNRFFRVVHLRTQKQRVGVVLLSYITEPFLLTPNQNISTFHSNYWECFDIAQAFLERGYDVDVINWNNRRFIPRKKYTVVFDIHDNIERLTPYLPEHCIKIMHITGAHPLFQNHAEYTRLLDLQKRRGVTLSPRRQVPPNLNIEHASCAIMLGNQFTGDTYAYAKKEIFRVPVSASHIFDLPKTKDLSSARTRFLWLGGSGSVHKGLDLVLEAFTEMPELQLTVCGPVTAEKDFTDTYEKELFEAPNISFRGRIDLSGSEFAEIARTHGAIIFPSSSEGGGGSVINCMQAGLIPIVTKEASIDIEDFGIFIEKASVEEIKKTARSFAVVPIEELSARSQKAWGHARAHHTSERFAQNFRQAIDAIIKTYGK